MYAQNARAKNNQSYTINIICALIEAQKMMFENSNKVYQIVNDVRMSAELNKDMNEEAIKIIFEYIDIYKAEDVPDE